MKTPPRPVIATFGLSLALTGAACADATPAQVTTTQTVTATATETVTATATVTAEPTVEASTALARDGDVTQALLAANPGQPWLTKVGTATRSSPDLVEVETTIRDPRGGTDGSPEAKEAVAICNAVAALLKSDGVGSPNVRVYETNRSTFAYSGKTSAFECVEY